MTHVRPAREEELEAVAEVTVAAYLADELANGAAAVVLSTLTTMVAAQRMYRRLGLRRAPERDRAGADVSMLVFVADAPPPDRMPG